MASYFQSQDIAAQAGVTEEYLVASEEDWE